MGQITNPIVKGITVNPVDRQSGPAAGAGAIGNSTVFLGAGAGSNSALSNFIAIGANAGANIADAGLNGSVILGVGNGATLVAGAGQGEPIILIGSDNLASTTSADSSVVMGSDNFQLWAGFFRNNVVIGNNIFPITTGSGVNGDGNVILGAGIGTVAFQAATAAQQSVIIGNQVFAASLQLVVAGSVIIGSTLVGATNIVSSVHIGNVLTLTTNQTGTSVTVGEGITMSGKNGGDDRNVIIGAAASCIGIQNTVIGHGASSPAAQFGNLGNTVIGKGAGSSLVGPISGVLVIEQGINIGGGVQALIYGDFLAGNMVLGTSVVGVNRDFGGVPGTNTLKLLNGTRATGAAIIGGGYFYVVGGVLHWVDSNGVDSQLSESVQGQLASSALAAFTNNAGAQTATLTNGPTAGNPTKWIPINDAGTIRNVPSW